MLPSHGRSRGFESLIAHHSTVLRPELLLLRHGETEWNRQGRFQGAEDSSLTENGRGQALLMGRLLQSLGVGPSSHTALTSPQGRARETAWIALSPLGLVAREDGRLAEIGMGEWTGLHRDEINQRWPGPASEALFDFYARCPGGESLGKVALRASALLDEVGKPTVIVTHGITLRILCALALGLPISAGGTFVMRQGCVIRIAQGRMDTFPPLVGLPASASPANSPKPGG